MIVHSLVILGLFLGCIAAPIVLAVSSSQENEHSPDPRDETATDTHFLKG